MENKQITTLDVVVYLDSLVSDSRGINTTFDKLRTITASIEPGTQLTPDQETALLEIRNEIEDYLIQRDPVRRFTKESLQQRIQEHFAPTGWADAPKRSLWLTWGTGVMLFGLAFALLPSSISADARGQVGAFLLLMTFGIGSAFFFLTSLRDFKPELKAAYLFLCLGALTISLTQIQLPIIALFDLGQTPLFQHGGFLPPFLLAMVFMYLGLRRYARIIGLHSRHLSLVWLGSGAVIVALATSFIPHSHNFSSSEEFFFDLAVASTFTNAYLHIAMIWITSKIIGASSDVYARTMKWLRAMLFVSAFGSLEYATAVYLLGELHGPKQAIFAVPYILSTLLLLHTGYRFKKASRY